MSSTAEEGLLRQRFEAPLVRGAPRDALVAAIAEALSDYKDNPGRLERLRRQAFAEVFRHYTWEKVLRDGYLPLYQKQN